jgi:ferredoxin
VDAGQPRSWRITVKETCVGSGMCAAIADGYFVLDSDDRSRPVAEQVAPADSVRYAAANCPMEAIEVTDTATGETIGC